MKTAIALFICMLFSSVVASAQNPRERIKQFKIAYLTEQLALSTTQAEKFWPIYNAYDADKQAMRKKFKDLRNGMMAKNDEQLAKDLDEMIRLREEEVAIEKKYKAQFLTVLTVRQLAALYVAEHSFKAELLRQFGRQNNDED